jgi:hypothetical protein
MLRGNKIEFDDEDDVIAKLSRPSPPPGEFVEEPEVQAVLEEFYNNENKKRKQTDRDLEAVTARLGATEIVPLAELSRLLDSTCLNSPAAAGTNQPQSPFAAPFRFHQPAAAENNASRRDHEDEKAAKKSRRESSTRP